MRARVLALLAVMLFPLVAALPAGAGGGGHGACSGFTKGTAIAIRDSCFQGVAHVATSGATITVTNEGQTTHDVVSFDGGFESGALQPGDRYELRLDRPGIYEYYCSFHGSSTGAGMAGVLVVEDPASLAAARSDAGDVAPATAASTAVAEQPGSAWGWVALGALLLAGAALCVSLAVIRPRRA